MPVGEPLTGVTETATSLATLPGENVTAAELSALVAVPPPVAVTRVEAGGEGPLPGTAAGSEAGRSALASAEVAPSLGVLGVVPVTVPPEPPDELPAALVVELSVCAPGSFCGLPESPVDESTTCASALVEVVSLLGEV